MRLVSTPIVDSEENFETLDFGICFANIIKVHSHKFEGNHTAPFAAP